MPVDASESEVSTHLTDSASEGGRLTGTMEAKELLDGEPSYFPSTLRSDLEASALLAQDVLFCILAQTVHEISGVNCSVR